MESETNRNQSYINLIRTSRELLVEKIKNTQCLLHNLIKNGVFSTEDEEIVLQFRTRADMVRQILDLVESKGEEASEYLISVIQRIPEAYYPLQPWLKDIGFQASDKIQNVQVINTDPVTSYSKKLKQELRRDCKIIMSYSQKEEMMLQETYVNGVMELLNISQETIGNVVDLTRLFDDNGVINEEGETIFIFGDAGMGKSLLLQKIQNMWAKEESYTDIKFLFRFRCRIFSFFKANVSISLKDLLFRYNCNPDHEPEDVYEYILNFPETVLFTFDGFDEIRSDFDINSIPEVPSPSDPAHPVALLTHLLSGRLLKGSKKILTGRTGCQVPGNMIRKKIMLKGFSTSNLLEYANLFFKEPDIKKHVFTHLNANHNFSSLCTIPLFCWIIFKSYAHFYSMNDSHCFSKSISLSISSVTLTDIFLVLVEVYLSLMSRETNRSQVETYKSCRDTLLSVGRLAYNGIEQSMFVFEQETVTSLKVPERDLKLGFLRTVEECGELGDDSSYEFFHVTLQSFFTALFLVIDDQTGTTELLKYFSECTHSKDMEHNHSLLSCVCSKKANQGDPFKNNDHLQFINLFLCGLLSKPKQGLLANLVPSSTLKLKRKALKQKLVQCVRSHLKSLPRSSFMGYSRVHALTHFIWMARCILETQSEKVGKLAAKGICADYIKLSFCGASSSDCGAISFLLNHYKDKLALELDNNNINDYGVRELSPSFCRLSVIRLSVNQITDEGARVLSEELTKHKIVTFLGLYKNLITDFGAKYISRIIIECPNLKNIKLGYNKFTGVGGAHLAEAIGQSSSICDVGMWGNQIGDEGAEAFAKAMRNHPSMSELSLACNQITSSGGKSIAEALRDNTNLKILWLTENKLTDEAAESFAEMLMVNKTLRHLWLVNNAITNEGANLLSKAIEHNTVIEEICLQGNPLTQDTDHPLQTSSRIFCQ
ncbi:nucleotide-binding oligomerization domain-containing protein 1 [Pelobates fuscus]|uniref:nucleotide-binding oligomerization domain-containing protein 1 n=1 Tax=Pelobates fuscus TaxID=191477 RepID=UPI002FE441D3